MSESWKEKAKTLVEIIRKGCSYVYITRCKDCIGECEFEGTESFAGKWVRLEDAEQTLAELKQKLQQLLKVFPDINNEKYKLPDGWIVQDILDSNVLFIKDVFEWKKKFKELLKEEKEAE
jgi:Ribonuclease G/E